MKEMIQIYLDKMYMCGATSLSLQWDYKPPK